MSEEIQGIKRALAAMGGHLHDLQVEQSQTVREVGELKKSVNNLHARAVSAEATLTALGGTFSSLETILTKLLSDQEQQRDTLTQAVSDLARRVEELERKAS